MFHVERFGNTLQFAAGPSGAVLRTAAPGEKFKVVDLENRFPLHLYMRLKEAATSDSLPYGTVELRLPRQEEPIRFMVTPRDESINERWVSLYYFEPIGKETTRFIMTLRYYEVEKWLRYIDENMTC